MPLTELMNYFNDQLHTQTKISSLPKNGFFKLNNGFGARFGSLLITPAFKKIIYKSEYLYGFYGGLNVRSTNGNKVNLDDIYLSLDSKEQIIHLDRLSRTLLSLNFLQQFDQHQVKLFLPVHPRHIASITENHGKIFEIILSDCGLGPNRVSLYTNFDFDSDFTHFDRALGSYKDKGYSVGINIKSIEDIEKLEKLQLSPHYVILEKKIANYWSNKIKLKPSFSHIQAILSGSDSLTYLNTEIDLQIIDQTDDAEQLIRDIQSVVR